MLHLTAPQMLALWKEQLLLQPVRSNCYLEREDGIDLDAFLTTHINHWYAHLLATAPAEWVPVEDVKDLVTLTPAGGGLLSARFPPQCVRPVEWRLSTWRCSVTTFLQPGSHEARCQLNPWTRAGNEAPAAIDMHDHLLLTHDGAATLPTVTVARCVTRPADGAFVFHHDALAQLIATARRFFNE